jgi:hypothetical protein
MIRVTDLGKIYPSGKVRAVDISFGARDRAFYPIDSPEDADAVGEMGDQIRAIWTGG